MYNGGLTYLTDSLKFYPIILSKNIYFLKNLLLIVWVFCLIVLLHRITELKNARSSIYKCLNLRTVSPCEGVKKKTHNARTQERKKFKLVENSSGAFKI